MGTWNADWDLQLASGLAYEDCAVGKFTLKKITDDTFEVNTTKNEPDAKWLGTTFTRRPGSPGPRLGWPLMQDAAPEHAIAAGQWVREKVQQQWDASHLQFECLEGSVPQGNGVEKIVLFKADEGFAGGDDFLVGIRVNDLDGAALPDGSVSGRRR